MDTSDRSSQIKLLLKDRPNVDYFDLQPYGYIAALTTYIEKLEVQLKKL